MSLFNKQALISELIDRTDVITSNTYSFLKLPEEQLSYKPAQNQWNVLEIFSHLNIINSNYINAIFKKIKIAPDVNATNFKSERFGDWVYEKLMPREDGSVAKFKSPKSFQASSMKIVNREIIKLFLGHQDELHDLLHYSLNKDLEKIRVPFYFLTALKLNLGDTLRILVAHTERHLLQANRLIEKLPVLQNG